MPGKRRPAASSKFFLTLIPLEGNAAHYGEDAAPCAGNRFKDEPGIKEIAQGIPIETAPAGAERPGRGDGPLEARPGRVRRTHVLHEQEPAARAQHTVNFAGSRIRPAHAAESEDAHHSIEETGGERYCFRLRPHQGNLPAQTARPTAGVAQHGRVRVQAEKFHARRVKRKVEAGAYPDLQDAPRRAGHEPAPPIPDRPRLQAGVKMGKEEGEKLGGGPLA
ncbi:MAG: hypothetical protein XD69_1147 [Clostridia bacterium 62_21]|nr:MAG: hypothetical protein XD69_1147 [Clostridia bacterium 62_21]